MLQYNFERGSIPEPYQRLDWTDFRERTNRDYGPPETSTKPEDWLTFQDLERDKDYLLSLNYF